MGKLHCILGGPRIMRKRAYNPLVVPNYDMVSASRYLHIPTTTLHFWTSGNDPIVQLQKYGRFPLLSFKNLVECYVVQGIRTIHGVHVARVRAASAWMRKHLASNTPLADYDLTTDGSHLYLRIDENLINISMRGKQGQTENAEIFQAHLERIERDASGVAMRLVPYKRRSDMMAPVEASKGLLIDPYVSFGRPILRESGIPTAALAGRYRAGDSISVLARSYGRKESEIREAVEWEIGKAA
jgi:uncharacterized protein (DUF433 family)